MLLITIFLANRSVLPNLAFAASCAAAWVSSMQCSHIAGAAVVFSWSSSPFQSFSSHGLVMFLAVRTVLRVTAPPKARMGCLAMVLAPLMLAALHPRVLAQHGHVSVLRLVIWMLSPTRDACNTALYTSLRPACIDALSADARVCKCSLARRATLPTGPNVNVLPARPSRRSAPRRNTAEFAALTHTRCRSALPPERVWIDPPPPPAVGAPLHPMHHRSPLLALARIEPIPLRMRFGSVRPRRVQRRPPRGDNPEACITLAPQPMRAASNILIGARTQTQAKSTTLVAVTHVSPTSSFDLFDWRNGKNDECRLPQWKKRLSTEGMLRRMVQANDGA